MQTYNRAASKLSNLDELHAAQQLQEEFEQDYYDDYDDFSEVEIHLSCVDPVEHKKVSWVGTVTELIPANQMKMLYFRARAWAMAAMDFQVIQLQVDDDIITTQFDFYSVLGYEDLRPDAREVSKYSYGEYVRIFSLADAREGDLIEGEPEVWIQFMPVLDLCRQLDAQMLSIFSWANQVYQENPEKLDVLMELASLEL